MFSQKIKALVFQLWTFVSLLKIVLNTEMCDGGIVVETKSLCPTPITCPEGMVKINLYSCAATQDFAVPSKCKTNSECWDGKCVDNPDQKLTLCPTAMVCPDLKIRCPDNSCVQNKDECPEYIDCPSFNPIRCPNGDCRKSLDDCPSLITCPSKFSMECNDGSCHMTSDGCRLATEETTCDKSMFRCPDGTCTSSKFLCPTPVTCPLGYSRCFDGNCNLPEKCLENVGDKQSSTCGDKKIVCNFDYSCVDSIQQCPTGIICPVDKPVKCWDNSCRDSINNCPQFQHCPSGLVECPDGSCGVGTCGTHITCSAEAPYRCFDNTCRRNPEDCPAQPSCSSETPILCWDGRCLAERGECLAPSICESAYPVKCPNGICVEYVSNCKEETDCPSEFIKCSDGTCRKKSAYCPEEKCPVNLPYKCKNGLCVSDTKFCEKDNGCPFNKPIKCRDGSCVKDNSECKGVTCPSGKKHCDDGSCLNKNSLCPSESGCPIDTPIRCADGTCINPNKASCSIPICSPATPIKCYDGTCVKTTNYCPTERKISEEGYVICADGREANSYDECKPLYACEEGEVRCDDGTCRSNIDECPLAKNTCPNGQIRCEGGSCADNLESCPASNGCPKSTPNKCPSTGFCVEDTDLCEEIESNFDEANGCPSEKPIKCTKINKCVSNSEDCSDLDNGCPSGKVMCDDGQCESNELDCFSDNHDEECIEEKPIDCPVDSAAICVANLGDCYSAKNCPFNKPFRCLNGDCHKYPFKASDDESDSCKPVISCPSYKKYLCADGSCVEKSSFCKSFSNCPKDKPYLCFDRTCAESQHDCELSEHQKCPANNPVLCPNSNCVSSIFDCTELTCPSWLPYNCVVKGICTNKPRECLKIRFDWTDYLEDTICEENEYMCYDGSCRKSSENCPIYPGCGSTSAPFKCLDGSCAINEESCEEGNNATLFECTMSDTKLCEDGTCRKNCDEVTYYGCPHSTPFLCPSGRCVLNVQECVGESACESSEKPFRCIDGSCAETIAECKTPFRENGITNISISIYPQMEVTSDAIIGYDNILIGSISIPSETITQKGKSEGAETQVFIRSIPRSVIDDTYTTYNETRTDDLKKIFPYSDPESNFRLSYQYSVLSTAFQFSLKDRNKTQISGKILFTLLYDFPYKHEFLKKNSNSIYQNQEGTVSKRYSTLPLNYLKDVCLGQLNVKTRKWECVKKSNSQIEDLNYLQLTGEIFEEGIYAVILNLRSNENKLYISDEWIINHLQALTISAIIILLIFGIMIYVFIRIYRYRVKYKGTQKKYDGFELELKNLQDQSVTGRQGQTLSDIKEGIIYTDNIAFKAQPSEARKKNIQLEKLFDGYTKRLRLLERNNALLKSQYDNIKAEYKRLNEYKAQLEASNDEGIKTTAQFDFQTKELTNMGESSINDS